MVIHYGRYFLWFLYDGRGLLGPDSEGARMQHMKKTGPASTSLLSEALLMSSEMPLQLLVLLLVLLLVVIK